MACEDSDLHARKVMSKLVLKDLHCADSWSAGAAQDALRMRQTGL